MRLNSQEKLRFDKQLLSLWSEEGDVEKWVPYKEIQTALTAKGLNKKTIMRHLNSDKFDKEERGYKKTFYKPKQWFRLYVEMRLAPKDDDEDRIRVWLAAREDFEAQYNKILEWYLENPKAVIKSREVAGGTGLSPENWDKLNELIDRLLAQLKCSLAVDFLADGKRAEDIYPFIVKNAINMLSAYMDLWAFTSKTQAAPIRFNQQMMHIEKSLVSFRRKAAKLKPGQ